jgi:hypothetical protein
MDAMLIGDENWLAALATSKSLAPPRDARL